MARKKTLLFIFIAVYILVFFITLPPYKNYLPIVWMLASTIQLFLALSKTRKLYDYISEKYPEHISSFNSMPTISVSKTVSSKDMFVKETITNTNNLYYIAIMSFLGFIVFHVGISFLNLWV